METKKVYSLASKVIDGGNFFYYFENDVKKCFNQIKKEIEFEKPKNYMISSMEVIEIINRIIGKRLQ